MAVIRIRRPAHGGIRLRRCCGAALADASMGRGEGRQGCRRAGRRARRPEGTVVSPAVPYRTVPSAPSTIWVTGRARPDACPRIDDPPHPIPRWNTA